MVQISKAQHEALLTVIDLTEFQTQTSALLSEIQGQLTEGLDEGFNAAVTEAQNLVDDIDQVSPKVNFDMK